MHAYIMCLNARDVRCLKTKLSSYKVMREIAVLPLLSAGLLSPVLTIRVLLIVYKIRYVRTFPLVITDFTFFNGNMDNKVPKQWSLIICNFGIRRIF